MKVKPQLDLWFILYSRLISERTKVLQCRCNTSCLTLEPLRDKTKGLGYALSDHPEKPPNLIRVASARIKKEKVLCYAFSAKRRLSKSS